MIIKNIKQITYIDDLGYQEVKYIEVKENENENKLKPKRIKIKNKADLYKLPKLKEIS